MAREAGYEQKKILERQDPGFGHKWRRDGFTVCVFAVGRQQSG